MEPPISAYVVHSRVTSLTGRPFAHTGLYRPPFRTIFENKRCFSDYYERRSVSPSAGTPFIRSVSELILSHRMWTLLGGDRLFPLFAPYLFFPEKPWWLQGGNPADLRGYFWLMRDDSPEEWRYNARKHYIQRCLGYASMAEDQRAHSIPFSLRNPLRLIAKSGNKSLAKGKIELHLYASGYFVTHLAIQLNPALVENTVDIRHVLQETRPWSRRGSWIWSSRLGDLTLPEVLKRFDALVQASLFEGDVPNSRQGDWVSAIKVRASAQKLWVEGAELGSLWLNLDKDQLGKPFQLSSLRASYKQAVEIYSTSRGMFMAGLHRKKRKTRNHRHSDSSRDLEVFWSALILQELILLKKQVYSDLNTYFKAELIRLKQMRLSDKSRLTRQPLLELSVFDENISSYLFSLDRAINGIPSWKRALYAHLSDNTRLDDLRERNKELLKEWEDEVEKYDPLLVYLWKKVLSPIRSMISI